MTLAMSSNVVGIIAELNPLHYGHCYLIQEAKKRTQADSVVCVMSGNYVQRGEPAIFDKWVRTQWALENDVDVVIEIPVKYCLGNASFFASAGVYLLEAFGGIQHLAFGVDTDKTELLLQVSELLRSDGEAVERRTQNRVDGGETYPEARSRVIADRLHICSDFMNAPNNILAIEYLRYLQTMKPVPIMRSGSRHEQSEITHGIIQSSTAIRSQIRRNEDISKYVPWNTGAMCYRDTSPKWFDLIRYAILSTSSDELDRAPGGGDGLGNRLQKELPYATSIEDLIRRTKSRRYTYTRISRWLYQILLGIRREIQYEEPEYLRILGFTEKGRSLIRQVSDRNENSLPFVTNIHKSHVSSGSLRLDVHASDIYNIAAGRDLAQFSDHRRKPVMV